MVITKNEKSKTQGVIKFSNLSKRYGSFPAVTKVNLEIKHGEILGFLGPNGAGKSTTMKMLAGLIRPTEGEIQIYHQNQWITFTDSTKDTLMDKMGFLIETPNFYDHLSPRTILTYFAKLKAYPRQQLAKQVENVVQSVGMMEWIDQPIKNFSKGMRQKIGIAAAIVHDPEIIVLDEPQSGLDPKAQKEMRDLIKGLKEAGKTIFLSSHLLYEISEVADRVAIIAHGSLIACDTLKNLEEAAKLSVIRLEILPEMTIESAKEIIKKYAPIITPLTGLIGNHNVVRSFMTFIPETKQFEIAYNGTRQTQFEILKLLIHEGLEVVDYSVPKASLLEALYLNLIQKSDQAIQAQKNIIQVNNIL